MVATNIDEWGLVRSEQEEIEESYFVSMTDIMVGLLFIFVIMLMAFGLMLKDAEDSTKTQVELKETQVELKEVVSATKKEIEEIQNVDSVRARMLRNIRTRLQQVGVYVTVQEENGVLRLPDEILFAKNERTLSPRGTAAIGHLARALDDILPCYAKSAGSIDSRDCRLDIPKAVHLEAVFVEGHTDKDGDEEYNWELSARRAINTFIELNKSSRVATRLSNANDQFLFSISGYGEHRPVNPGETREDMARNRRIDLRFVMNVSHKDAFERVRSSLQSALDENDPS